MLDFNEEDSDSCYCETCGCCAEIPCCNVEKFLGHAEVCKYFEVYKKEILDNMEKVYNAENILYSDSNDSDKLIQLRKLFEAV